MKAVSYTNHCASLGALLEKCSVELKDPVEQAIDVITDAYHAGGKVIVFGNGGSAADASHFAAEFVGRYRRERRALPAISLSAESSAVTAIGNDYGFEKVFSRQIEAFGRLGDVVVGLTTSGKSANVLRALEASAEIGLATVALTGSAGLASGSVDVLIAVPSAETFEIQEVHKVILHSICEAVEFFVASE